MIIRIDFSMPTEKVPVNPQHKMNGFFYSVLGNQNKNYHDSFSDYAVSSLQGGKLNKDSLEFETNPYILISTQNKNLVKDILVSFNDNTNSVYGMTVEDISFSEYQCHNFFDKIVTISPILLKRNGIKISWEDEGYLDFLKEHCVKKLKNAGIDDETFDIQPRGYLKKKLIMVGDVKNISTMGSFKVFGKRKTRETLYNLGIGGSTGSGFGSIKIYNSDSYEE